jgi:hypothetical protein
VAVVLRVELVDEDDLRRVAERAAADRVARLRRARGEVVRPEVVADGGQVVRVARDEEPAPTPPFPSRAMPSPLRSGYFAESTKKPFSTAAK